MTTTAHVSLALFWKIKVFSLLSLSLDFTQLTTTRHFYVYVPSQRSPISLSEMRRTPSYRRRSLKSDERSTPDRIPYSPSSSYSDASTGQKSSSGRSVVAVTARSVAGAFVSCFTLPETKSSVSFAGSEKFRAPSGNFISVTFFQEFEPSLVKNVEIFRMDGILEIH